MEQRDADLTKRDLQEMYEQLAVAGDVEALRNLSDKFLGTHAVSQTELDSMIAALSSSQETASRSSALEDEGMQEIDLCNMDDDDYDNPEQCVVDDKENDEIFALGMQYEAARESNNLNMVLSLQEPLITHGILDADEFQAVVVSLTPTESAPVAYSPGSSSSSSRSVSPEEQARIMQDREIREETERAYRKSLRIDEQREWAATQIQSVCRANIVRKKFLNDVADLSEFNRLAQLDEGIVELARSANPQDRSTINGVMAHLGNNVKLLQLFRRIADPIAQVLNPTADRAELQQSVASVLIQDDHNQNLASLRAQRIVDSYLR